MQLKNKGRVSQALAAATCSLLSASSQAVDKDTTWDLTHLHYAEQGRVTVKEQIVAYRREQSDEKSFAFKLYHDSISGATPNGAAPGDTYTSPSGQTYISDPGVTPTMQFEDERIAATAEWSKQLNRLKSRTFGLSVSNELDYNSLATSYTTKRDTQDRMRTYEWGASLSYDTINADGGIPTPLAVSTDTTRYASDNKAVIDLLAGMTQVLSRRSLLQMNYTLGLASGYLTDPYKYISVVGAGVDPLQFESRPGNRIGHSLYSRGIFNRKGDVARVSYRFYTDDWGILSHTLDARYRFKPGKSGWSYTPRIRYYNQSAAYFYGYTFYQDTPVTSYASSDYRLGNLQTITVGLHMGHQLSRKRRFGLRFEYMQQSDRAGWFDTVNTLIAQFSYQYDN